MAGVPQFISEGPFPVLVIFLALVVFSRSQGTYWLARLITSGVIKTSEVTTRPWLRRVGRWLQGASVQQGMDMIDRWGLITIPLSFLTIGIQTVIHAGAGVLRLRWWLYTLVALPGYFAWGFLYATVALSVVKTGQAAILGKTWAVLLTAGVLVAVVLFSLHRFRVAKSRIAQDLD